MIPQGITEFPVHVPMKVERAPARAAYDEAVRGLSDHLGAGKDVAYLCVGDPLFYGLARYLCEQLGNDRCDDQQQQDRKAQ